MSENDDALARWRDRCAELPPLNAERVAAVAVILDRVGRRRVDAANEPDRGEDPDEGAVGGQRAA